MDNSAGRQSASSSNISDPFRDPDLPSQTYQSEQPTPSNTSHEVLPPIDINTSQIRERDVSNLQHQEQLPNAFPSSQIGSDAILPIRPVYHAASYVVHGTSPDGTAGLDHPKRTDCTTALSELVTRRVAGVPVDRSPEIIKTGKRKISITKWILIIVLLAVK